MKNNYTLHEKALVLYDLLIKREDWTTQETICELLPEYFPAKKSASATTLNRQIYDAMYYINDNFDLIVINDNKRRYKIANEDEAIEFIKTQTMRYAKGFKRIHKVSKKIKTDGAFDLFKNLYVEVFRQ